VLGVAVADVSLDRLHGARLIEHQVVERGDHALVPFEALVRTVHRIASSAIAYFVCDRQGPLSLPAERP
jgi:hypothetical protein